MTSSESWPCAAVRNAELAPRTTMKVGGRAQLLLEPADPNELRDAYVTARDRELPVRLLGGGANLVIDDGVVPGVVIATERMRRVFRPSGEQDTSPLESGEGMEPTARVAFDRERDPRLVAWCGASMPGLARSATKLGWTGLEGLVGVPGSIGGGLAMNAGGRWGEVWETVETILVLTPAGELIEKRRDECAPGYRNGNLGDEIAVGCVLRLEVETIAAVKERAKAFLLEKNAVQPVSDHSAGCVFKNPDRELSGGKSAGLLIEESGGKGRSIGTAVVSPLHGNFIVNRGGASGRDVLALIDELQDLVAQKTGIRLEVEVERWTDTVPADA